MDNEMKICSKCKIEKPFIEFSKNNTRKIGYRANCKKCQNAYYIINKTELCEKKRQYCQLHKIELCEKKRQYYILNAIKIKDRVNKRYQLNKIAINEKNKKYTQTKHGKAVKRMCEHRRRALLKNNTPVGKNFTADDLIMKLKLQNNRCVYCNINIANCYEVEHFIPISKGGSNEPSNIQLLCQNCNRGIGGKHSKLPYEYALKHGKLF